MGDIRESAALESALNTSRAEVVIHMAAQPLVRYSYANPIETYEVNVMGTANLLEAVRKAQGVRAVVNVTTDKCYENREWVWGYRENEALGGYDPYSSSKACSELVTAAYRQSFFGTGRDWPHVAVATARAGNVIGGGDWSSDRIVPDFFRAIESGVTLRIRNPTAIRPWQHVLEPLSGYLLLAERLHDSGDRFAEAWNFGPSAADAVAVHRIVELLGRFWGPSIRTKRIF
jgi:CDP-glucose 4,6-dehydratase